MGYILDGFIQALRLILSLDPEVLSIAWLSLRVAVIAAAAASLLGIPLAYLLVVRESRFRRSLLTLANTLMALPTVLVGLLCYSLLSRRGPLGALMLLFTPSGIIIGDVVLVLPLVVALGAAAIRSVDPRARATALSLGASPLQAALAVLSEARFALAAVVISGFGRVVAEVGAAMMLGGNIRGYTRTLTTAIALETGRGEFAPAVALGIVLLVLALAANLIFHRLQEDGR